MRLRRVRVAPLGEFTLESVMRMRAGFAQQWTWRVLPPARPWNRCVHCGAQAWIATGRACADCLNARNKVPAGR